MRNSTERFVVALQSYLKTAFTERVSRINEKDSEIRLADIALWQSGYNGVLSGLTHYPGCIVLVNGKTLTDPYTTEYSVVIGIGLTADDPDYLERMGRYWEDILEDSIRSDWTLGGTAIDTDVGVRFNFDCTSNVYLIQAELTCQVDIGGYVYMEGNDDEGIEEGTEGGSGDAEVFPMPEVPPTMGAVSSGEGDGVLSPLRDDHDADTEGIGTEDASVRLEVKEE